MQADPALHDSRIAVQSVHQGVVLLGGTAQTLSDHLRAVALTASVPGVRQVTSEVQSPDTLADAEIWREPTPQQPSAMDGMGAAARDLWITSATKMRLLADSRTPALDIHVDTRAGVVTLFGMVPSQEARAAAEADAHTVRGVQSVVNDLQVVARAEQAAVQARDEELSQAVQTAFATPAFKNITVMVQNGVVRLTGTVPTGAQRPDAAVVARAILAYAPSGTTGPRPPRTNRACAPRQQEVSGQAGRHDRETDRCSKVRLLGMRHRAAQPPCDRMRGDHGAHKENSYGWQERQDQGRIKEAVGSTDNDRLKREGSGM
jgi:hyperosmotically inducible protein